MLATVVLLGLTVLMMGVDAHAQIAFVSNRSGNWDIYVMDIDGQNPRNLTKNRHNDWHPSWSPDGQSIVFASNRDGNLDIYVTNADGNNQRNLTKNRHDDSSLSWSPDSKRVVFSSDRGDDPEDTDI